MRGDYAPPPQPEAPSAPASGAPPVVPARVPAPVVVVPDGGGSGVSGVSDVQNLPQPSHCRVAWIQSLSYLASR